MKLTKTITYELEITPNLLNWLNRDVLSEEYQLSVTDPNRLTDEDKETLLEVGEEFLAEEYGDITKWTIDLE